MKHFKITVGVIILMLMLTPFISFAAKAQQKGDIEQGTGLAEPNLVAEQKGIHEPGTGIAEPELREAGQGTGQGMEAPKQTMLQNQGEEQQNAVQAQTDPQGDQAQGQANGKGQNQASDKATQRRSKVANAVQEMLKVAERNQGVGQQIRTIAQTQNQSQEQIEASMDRIKNRGQLKKFFFGPDYKNLNSVEDRLANHTEKLDELKDLAAQITNPADAVALLDQIEVMEQIGTELSGEVAVEKKGFSLFGWLNKWLSK
ncbi:hypothetical protein KAJ89_04190 [Candidatus Parcubacteria bacterium]|nr:hypothetical protein [Candidatus Parcubacteria bacterium]